MPKRWLWVTFSTLLIFSLSYYLYNYKQRQITLEEYSEKAKQYSEKLKQAKLIAQRAAKSIGPTATPISETNKKSPPSRTSQVYQKSPSPIKKDERMAKLLFADIVVEGMGVITIQLLPQRAPKTVKTFIRHCEDGTIEENGRPLYSDIQFFRTVRDYFIQTGDPLNNGKGNPGTLDIQEFNTAPLEITKGMVVMAKLGNQNSRSQFYIALRDMNKLVEGRSTVFATVISGLTLVETISRVRADLFDKPLKPVIVKEIKIRRIY